MFTLFLCFVNGCIISLLAIKLEAPDIFISFVFAWSIISFWIGCVVEARKKVKIEAMEREIQDLRSKIILLAYKLNIAKAEEARKNETDRRG